MSTAILSETELIEELLATIDRRRAEAHRRFRELARRRAALSRSQRNLARETLRVQAAEISGELVRLKLAYSLALTLSRDPGWGCGRSSRRFAPRGRRSLQRL